MANPLFNFTSLKFPDEVGTDEVPNYIRFEPTIVKYGGTSKTFGNEVGRGTRPWSGNVLTAGRVGTIDVVDYGIANRQAGLDVSIMDASNAIFEALSSAIGYKISRHGFEGMGGINRVVTGRTTIGGKQLETGLKVDPNQMYKVGSINLFLPEGLSTKSSVEYGAVDLTATGFEAIGMATNPQAKSDAIRKSEEGGETMSSSGIMKLFPAMIQDATRIDDRLRAAAAISRGVVTNNYSYQVFNGVSHRSFSYTFKMIPRSDQDSATIKQICDHFLYYMLPEKDNTDFHLYNIPCQWNIHYMRKGNPLQFHQSPYPCFLQSVDVAYGADTGNATFNDGAPLDVTLSLEFIEIEPMHRRPEQPAGDPGP